MVRLILISCALVGSIGVDDERAPAATPTDLTDYQAARSKAGHNPDAHVRLALWCEAHGLTAERIKHLSLAVLYDPSHALARGLMGLVAYQGNWDRPDVIGQQIQNDPAHQAIVKEYLDRRAHAADTADAQMKLAAWCEEKGLKDQAIAHYTAVTRIDPAHDSAWKHLGFKKQGHGWVKPEEAAAAKQEAARQKQADRHWKTRLERLREGLDSKDAARRTKALQELTQVTDPRAVPMIWSMYVRGGERLQIAAVQMLGQIDGPSASNGLAALAVFSPAAEVRRRAIETLTRRDPRDVVGRLIALIHKPYKYQVRHVNGPGSPGELFVEGERFNIQRFYQNQSSTTALSQGRIYTPDVAFDPFSYQNIALATMTGFVTNPATGGLTTIGKPGYSITIPFPVSPEIAAQAGQAMAADPGNAAAILGELINNPANRVGPPALGFPGMGAGGNLGSQNTGTKKAGAASVQSEMATEMMLSAQPAAARQDLSIGNQLEAMRLANLSLEQRLAMDVQFIEATNGRINAFNERTLPVLRAITGQHLGPEPEKWKGWWTDQLGYVYQSNIPATKPTYSDFVGVVGAFTHSACFAAGTLVQTVDGPRPIESVRVGDRVLSQGTSTGALAFQPVVAAHRNPSNPTLRIAIADDTIVATGIHRFWKAGTGWTMARELKPGDRLRKVGGTVAIGSISADQVQPVFNLDVAENRDFFVGTGGLLVHDYSFVQPVLEPFDRQAEPGTLVPMLKGNQSLPEQ
jgi:tetratricopeptide (TPR) repeat protein